MCGIAGLITKTNNSYEMDQKDRVRKMTNLLSHRGPDGEGYFNRPGLTLGHRRLAIIDTSNSGHQPMGMPGAYIITFNGEIFNFLELRDELISAGFIFSGLSDTEVLLKAYEHWKDGVVNKIKGFFAFAIWDENQKVLFCARDPFGKKPFYWHFSGSEFLFSSEVQSLISGLNKTPDINKNVLSYYLLNGYFPKEESIYQSVNTLNPGSVLKFYLNNFSFENYLYCDTRFDGSLDLEESTATVIDRCKDLIDEAVRKRLYADVPIGVTLSGGVDSSLLATLSSKHLDNLQTFTVRFANYEFDESKYAAEVATLINSNHQVLNVENTNLNNILSNMVEVYGEPFGDYSAIPTFNIFRAMADHVKVAITGDGGDEVFGGYDEISMFFKRKRLESVLGLTDIVPSGIVNILTNSTDTFVRRTGHAVNALKYRGEEGFLSLRSHGWTKRWRKNMMTEEGWFESGKDKGEEIVKSEFSEAGSTDVERYLNASMVRLTQDFLVKIDRASMANSIEARSPLLDIDLFQYVRGLKPSQMFPADSSKYLIKTMLSESMGENFVSRQKMGFTPPLRNWLQLPENVQWIRSSFEDRNAFTTTMFKPGALSHMLDDHIKGRDHTNRLWNVIFLNRWYEKYGEI